MFERSKMRATRVGACLALLSTLSVVLAAQAVGPNRPPIAVAGGDQTIGTVGLEAVAVNLYGAASSDPDGDRLTYSWVDANGHFVGSTANVSVSLLPGSYRFALTVFDGRGGTGSDDVYVIVVGDTEPPIVIAPPDITVGITTDTGAKASDDDDLAAFLVHSYAGDLLDITPTFLGAQVGGQNIGNDYEFPIGVTPVTFRWRDHAANVGSATATVTVLDHLKKGDLLVGESVPRDSGSFGRIERVRNGVALPFCDADSSPVFWDGPSDLIVDSKGRVVFLAAAVSNVRGWNLLRCTRPGEPVEVLAKFALLAIDAPATPALPFPKYGFNEIGALHLAKRTLLTVNNDQNGGWPKVGDDETYNLQGAFYEFGHDARLGGDGPAQTKTFVYHLATGEWDANGPAGAVLPNATVGSMFFNGGNTYAVHSNIIRGVIDPFKIDAGLKVGDVFSGKLSLALGGGAAEYVNLVLNDQNIPDVQLPPTLCGGASVPLRDGGFTSFAGSQIVFDTWGDLGLIASGSGGPFMTNIGTEMFEPNGAPPSFPQPFNGCLPTPEISFAAPLPPFAANGQANAVDRMASTRLGIVGTRFWANDIVKLPGFGGDQVETVASNIPHPLGIAGFPEKVKGSYGVVVGISIQSPVNILMTDALGHRIGTDLATGAPVNDFGADGVDSGAGTEPRYFFVKNPAPGPYSVQTVGTGDGPYTVDVYSSDGSTGLGGRLTHTGTAAIGSVASHDFALAAGAGLTFTSPSSNHPPTAVAGPGQTITATSATGAVVHLDGSQSSDPDGDTLTYAWTGPFGILTGAVIDALLPVGTHALNLTVDDGHGANAKAIVIVTVNASASDTQPPAVVCGSADGVWHNADVTIACTAADSGSGLANASDATFSLGTSVATGTETTGALTGSRTVCDVAHNCVTVGPIGGNHVDKRVPAITIAAPSSAYLLSQSAVAAYSCADSGSGVASCNGPVPNGSPLDTSAVGSKNFLVAAADRVGNTATRSIVYDVGYDVCLFRDADGRGKDDDDDDGPVVRLQICTAGGANRSARSIIVTPTQLVNAGTHAVEPLDVSTGPNRRLEFRFQPSIEGRGAGYVFDLHGTHLPPGNYTVFFSISGDPTAHHVDFQVRRKGGRS